MKNQATHEIIQMRLGMFLSTGGRVTFAPSPKLFNVVAWVGWLSKTGTRSAF